MEGAARAWGSPPVVETGSRRPLVRAGWRKMTLYAIVLSLLLIVLVNIGLTFWILAVLRFSSEGIGPIRILQGGIQLSERTFVSGQLVTSSIASGSGRQMALHSYRNFSINVFDDEGHVVSSLVIKKSGIHVTGDSFSIADGQGRSLLSAERGEVRVGAEVLSVHGTGGITVDTAVQTAVVRSDASHDLSLESLTRSLKMRSPQEISLESSARGIRASTFGDIHLVSAVGAVQLDASNVYMKNLTIANTTSTASTASAAATASVVSPTLASLLDIKIYQLCACADGKLFLAPSEGLCHTKDTEEVCR